MNRLARMTASTVLPFACTALLFTGAGFFVQLSGVEKAEACRDCPFPTPMSALHWRLPSGNSDVTVQEINIGSGGVQSVVRLIDARTGELLAIGHQDHQRGRRRLRVDLYDMAGGKMEAHLTYEDRDRTKVRIRITCQECNLKSTYLN